MKVSMATLCLLVLLLTTPVLCSQPNHKEVIARMPIGINLSADCCLKFYKKILPRRLLKGYRNAVRCHPPAIIFVTIKNREVCTNLEDNWVQEYLQDPDLPLLPPSTLAWG